MNTRFFYSYTKVQIWTSYDVRKCQYYLPNFSIKYFCKKNYGWNVSLLLSAEKFKIYFQMKVTPFMLAVTTKLRPVEPTKGHSKNCVIIFCYSFFVAWMTVIIFNSVWANFSSDTFLLTFYSSASTMTYFSLLFMIALCYNHHCGQFYLYSKNIKQGWWNLHPLIKFIRTRAIL